MISSYKGRLKNLSIKSKNKTKASRADLVGAKKYEGKALMLSFKMFILQGFQVNLRVV